MKTIKLILPQIALILATAALAQQDSSGLIAHFPLHANALEASGHCNDGYNFGALPTRNSCGWLNSALDFNGKNNYIEVANCPSLELNQGLSVCAWVKPRGFYSGVSQSNFMVSRGNNWTAGSFALDFHDSDNDPHTFSPATERFVFQMGMGVEPYYKYVTSSTLVQLNQWYFVVGTSDGVTQKIYVNGVLEETKNIDMPIGVNTDNLLIGKHRHPDYEYWLNGTLEDVRIYNKAISLQEIQSIYNSHCLVNGLNQIASQATLSLYPNPTQDNIQISCGTTTPSDIALFDLNGKLLLQVNPSDLNQTTIISLADLPNGIYVARIMLGEEVVSKKIVKE